MQRTLIIGGGVAGLMAALHLAERGLAPLLLEADPRWIGGRLRGAEPFSFEQDGQLWSFPGEHGVHGIWLPYRNFKGALRRHALLPALLPAREETWVYRRGGRVRRAAIGSAIRGSPLPAPFHYLYCFLRPDFLNMLAPADVLSLPVVLMSLFAAMAIDPLAERKTLEKASLEDFTRSWSPALRSLFAGLARSGLSAHPEEVPAAGWIAFLRFYTLLRRDAWQFAYLPGTGGECVAEPLAARVRALGGEIRLGWRALELQRAGEGWRVQAAVAGADGTDGERHETLEAEYLILAQDAPAAQRLLQRSPATAAESAALRFPRGTPSAVIRLWFGAQPRRGSEAGIYTGDFVMDNFFWLHRLQPAYQQWSQATSGSAIEMHVYSSPDLLQEPDALLLARVVTDTYRAFPDLAGTLLHARLQRNAATQTLFNVGSAGQHLASETPWPRLFACGDWVYHPTPALFLERATITGIAAANAVLACCGQPGWLPLPPLPPEVLAGRMATVLWRARQRVLRRRQKR